jgi:hypothetical protein
MMHGAYNDTYCKMMHGAYNDTYCRMIHGAYNDTYCRMMYGAYNVKFLYPFVSDIISYIGKLDIKENTVYFNASEQWNIKSFLL